MITKPKLKQSLLENADLARLSRELAVLHTDVPLNVDLEQLVVKDRRTIPHCSRSSGNLN